MNILNPEFKYTPAVATDIRKLFARVRREQKKQHEQWLEEKTLQRDQHIRQYGADK